MATYRRHKSTPIHADVFRVGARLLGEKGLTLASAAPADLAVQIAAVFAAARSPIRLHGTRAEEMFAYAMAAVGSVRAIKREETDDLVVAIPDALVVPDFRVVLQDGADILVEVKNFHDKDPSAAPRLTSDYLRKLSAYGALFSRPVYLAVYWSVWRRWTLHNVNDLAGELSSGLKLSFPESSNLRVHGGAVKHSRPQGLLSPPYPRVGEKYYGVDLPLWILVLQPERRRPHSARKRGATRKTAKRNR